MSRIIEIIVPTGETTVQTKGFAGQSCRDASKFLEQALGQRTDERLTAEFHQAQPSPAAAATGPVARLPFPFSSYSHPQRRFPMTRRRATGGTRLRLLYRHLGLARAPGCLAEIAQTCRDKNWRLAVWNVSRGLQLPGQAAVQPDAGAATRWPPSAHLGALAVPDSSPSWC